MKESRGYKIFRIVNTIIMILVVLVTLYPFLYLVAQSFSSERAIYNGEVTIFPVGFNVETYKQILSKGDFLLYYKNNEETTLYHYKYNYILLYTKKFAS